MYTRPVPDLTPVSQAKTDLDTTTALKRDALAALVHRARADGATWDALAAALDVTRQAVIRRFS